MEQDLRGAWERGELDTAITILDGVIDTWRELGNDAMLASGLFNQALVLHETGAQARAAGLLAAALQLRRDRFGDHHGLVGATLRAAGDVAAARGQDDEALAMLRRAVALTSAGYGASHPAADGPNWHWPSSRPRPARRARWPGSTT